MAESFDKNTLNEAVFEPMCSGFSDSSAALRELTLKATAALVPHLTHPNLEKLSRYLVRLQSDPESSIRTNTVIFFSKLAPFLTESTRQKMLLPAFERAMKDPFTPCRLAALKSTLKAKEFFDPMGIACRVLPVITPQLLDPSPEVRREALIAVDDLLFVLRQESERLNRLPVSEPAQLNPGTGQSTYVPNTGMAPAVPVNGSQAPSGLTSSVPAAPKSGSSFSLGGISSWMTSSKSSAPVVNNSSAVTTAPSAVPPQQPHMTQQNYHATAPVGTQHHISQPSVPISRMKSIGFNENVNDDFGGDDGWDDEDDLDVSAAGDKARGGAPVSDFGFSAPAATASASGSLFVAPTSDDDFFGSFDAKPAKPMAMRTMSSGGSKLIMPAKKVGTKPAVQKLSTDTDNASDGWDDF